MARCINPFRKKGESIDLPCGKCYACRARRVSAWSFRLMQEDKISDSAMFVTLTYKNPPISDNGFMTLDKKDVQKFMKRLRWYERKNSGKKIKYYLCGEYGEYTYRPHYHVIIFNTSPEMIEKAWCDEKGISLGYVHYGLVSKASVGYTLKYMSKPGKIPRHERDDRVPEFRVDEQKDWNKLLIKRHG